MSNAPVNRIKPYVMDHIRKLQGTMPKESVASEYIRQVIREAILNDDTLYFVWNQTSMSLSEFCLKFSRDVRYTLELNNPGFDAQLQTGIKAIMGNAENN
jgi:hypothetical protein